MEPKNLKLIVFTGIGAANFVDLDAAKQQGIIVCNTPGYADQTVAEHTIALMLSSARNISKLDATMRQGEWASGTSGFNLEGKTLGIVGLGGIGGRVAGLANAFGFWHASGNIAFSVSNRHAFGHVCFPVRNF